LQALAILPQIIRSFRVRSFSFARGHGWHLSFNSVSCINPNQTVNPTQIINPSQLEFVNPSQISLSEGLLGPGNHPVIGSTMLSFCEFELTANSRTTWTYLAL
jgi:hypothetical protein